MRSIWPPSSATVVCELPRNGTWIMSMPAWNLNASSGMCEAPPMPLDPKLYLPGAAFAIAMNSAVLRTGRFGLVTITSGNRVTSETLAKSARTS